VEKNDMKWWTALDEIQDIKQPVALTIGNFDGVHRGHQELLRRTVDWAQSKGGSSVLLTFYPHPLQVLHPERKHVRLFDQEDQRAQLEKSGLTGVFQQSFSRDFSEMSGPDFLENYLLKFFHPQCLVIGHDFSFGQNREGHQELMKTFCARRGIELQIVPALQVEGVVASTSKIREALLSGNLELAKKLLGRNYSIQGVVEKGDARGRMLGFPTANIRPVVDFYPKIGVYACRATVVGDKTQTVHKAVTNIGLNRTFVEGENHPIKVEAHLLGFSGDLYGKTMKLELIRYLREEKKFAGIEELKAQIARDADEAKRILS
jgi:riboflavin kinase/FMN adenylyltransferase